MIRSCTDIYSRVEDWWSVPDSWNFKRSIVVIDDGESMCRFPFFYALIIQRFVNVERGVCSRVNENRKFAEGSDRCCTRLRDVEAPSAESRPRNCAIISLSRKQKTFPPCYVALLNSIKLSFILIFAHLSFILIFIHSIH